MCENGFVYIWFDYHNKMYYVGSHCGPEDDGYICSSPWMNRAFKNRPHHFKRRILKRFDNKEEMIKEEDRYLSMMKPEEFRTKYYNIRMASWELWHHRPDSRKTVGQKISAAKKGKNTGPRDPSVGQAISESKKKGFAKRGGMSDEHKKALSEAKLTKNHKHTDEWKTANSKMMKERHAKEALVTLTCPHCGTIGKSVGMKRWHFDNCRIKMPS